MITLILCQNILSSSTINTALMAGIAHLVRQPYEPQGQRFHSQPWLLADMSLSKTLNPCILLKTLDLNPIEHLWGIDSAV